ncbi:MAG TPA: peptidoglycan-binding domain-containing protein [Hansschlegelia sp.]
MPKAAPRYRDFDDDEPTSGAVSGALAVLRRRPIDTLAAGLAVACTVMTLVNALALQQGRHPSPFFGEAAPPAPLRSELVSQIQSALADIGYYDGAVDGLMGARTAAAIRTFEQAQRLEPTGQASDRVLAAALVAPKRKAEAAPAGPVALPPTTPAAAPATTGSTGIPVPKMMAVQRALAKLGYGPVTIDGKLGAETRAALQSFERDRKMPETGEPTPPVLRSLQAMAGTPLQ